MSRNVQAVIDRILAREGGIADVGDGAGVTRFGQTPAWLQTYGFNPPNTPQEAAGNYARWMEIEQLDAVCDFDVELGDDVCDAAVNDGIATAIKMLQTPLGVRPDGRMGPVTIGAMLRANPEQLRAAVLAVDIEYHGRLIADHPALYAKFAGGWATRQADKVRRLG